MPKQIASFQEFSLGMIGSSDPQDLPADRASYAENIEILSTIGELRPLPDDDQFVTGYRPFTMEFIENGGQYDLIMVNDGAGSNDGITRIADYYGTATASQLNSTAYTGDATSVSHNREVYVGLGNTSSDTPLWVGFHAHKQFDTAAPSAPEAIDGRLLAQGVTLTPSEGTADADGPFLDTRTYYYAYALVYDGYQISALAESGTLTPSQELADVDIQIDITVSGLSRRVSAIEIYRNQIETVEDGFIGEYTLVQRVSLANTATNTPWSGTTTRTYTITDSYEAGQTYNQRTGLLETIDNLTPHYALSERIDSYHVIADCYHPEIDNAERYVFRSKANRFSQFDWLTDFLILPSKPTAVAAFQGRIYVFDEARMHRIEPEFMVLEDTYEDAGCISREAVATSEVGMMWCSRRGIYFFDGSRVQNIGQLVWRVEYDQQNGWENTDFTEKVTLSYDSERAAFVLMHVNGNAEAAMWLYRPSTQTWMYVTTTHLRFYSSVKTPRGQVLYAARTATPSDAHYTAFALGTNRTPLWVSPRISPSGSTRPTRFYKIRTQYETADGTVAYEKDDDGFTVPSAVSEVTGFVNYYDVATADRKAYAMRVRVSGATLLRSLDVIFRPLTPR